MLKSVNEEHARASDEMRASHEAQIASNQEMHERTVQRLKDEHAKAIAEAEALVASLREEIAGLKSRIEQLEAQVDSL